MCEEPIISTKEIAVCHGCQLVMDASNLICLDCGGDLQIMPLVDIKMETERISK